MIVSMEGLPKIIGKNIRKFWSLNEMTRKNLAKAVDLVPAYLGQCERREIQLSLSKTVKIIEYFGISANNILDIKRASSSEKKLIL